MKTTMRARIAARPVALILAAAVSGLWAAAPRAEADEHQHGGEGGWTASRPDGHAPIGVMGDHIHAKGELMLSYRYMFMHMDGNRSGSDSVSADEVLADFMVSPTEMDMEMHMFGIMYAFTDALTAMFMVPVVRKSMDHVTRMGTSFNTEAIGPGDMRLAALYGLLRRGNHRLHLSAGISLPTGSIDEKDDTPMGPDSKLPYPMQLGSGTFDVLPGLTYLGQSSRWSWGAQATGTVRLGENEDNYTLGDAVELTAWGAHRFSDWLSASLRADGRTWDDIDGFDDDLPAPGSLPVPIVPTAEPGLRGGRRLDLLAGINLYVPQGRHAGHRLAVEVGVPVYQHLDGPQLENDWVVTVGWQLSI